MSNQIAPEIAQKEVEQWLDYKQVETSKRESYKDNIETLVNAIVAGRIVIDSEKQYKIQHNLKFPFGEDVKIVSFDYKARLKVNEVTKAMQGVKATDISSMIGAYLSALSGQPKAVIGNMDTEDYNVAQSVAIFFL